MSFPRECEVMIGGRPCAAQVPSETSFRRHLVRYHHLHLVVRTADGERTERFVRIPPEEVARRVRQYNCRQGGRAEQRAQRSAADAAGSGGRRMRPPRATAHGGRGTRSPDQLASGGRPGPPPPTTSGGRPGLPPGGSRTGPPPGGRGIRPGCSASGGQHGPPPTGVRPPGRSTSGGHQGPPPGGRGIRPPPCFYATGDRREPTPPLKNQFGRQSGRCGRRRVIVRTQRVTVISALTTSGRKSTLNRRTFLCRRRLRRQPTRRRRRRLFRSRSWVCRP